MTRHPGPGNVPAAILLAVLLGCQAPPGASVAGRAGETRPQAVTLVRVTDGDTLLVRIGEVEEWVRLIGVDAPELGRGGVPAEPFAAESRERARMLAAGGSLSLTNQVDREDRDAYGRLLRFVYASDGRLINLELIRSGHAAVLSRFPFHRLEEFQGVEAEARRARRGLWADR